MSDTRKSAALTGALVADAASMGFHWLYDQARIAELAADAPEFRTPNESDFTKGYFAHGGKQAGAPSQYGAQMQAMTDTLAQGPYTPENYANSFKAAFGYGGTWVGYIDRPTRETLDAMALAEAEESPTTTCGADDAQLPALSKLPPLIAAHLNDPDLETHVKSAVRLTNNRDDSEAWGLAFTRMLSTALKGGSQAEIIEAAGKTAPSQITQQIETALKLKDANPQDVATQTGLHCQLEVAFPVILHSIATAASYQSAIRNNILAGGDNCGRAIPIGAILGALWADDPKRGIPEDWIARTDRA